MATVTQHFVTFYSPGTFVAEQATKPIEAWDIQAALALAAGIIERHNATPYAFKFTTRTRGENDLDSHVSVSSLVHYFGVKVETLAEIKARNDPADSILVTNMEANRWGFVARTTKGWRSSFPLEAGDVVVLTDGTTITFPEIVAGRRP